MSLNKATTLSGSTVSVSAVGVGTWAIGGPYWTDGEPTGWSGPLNDEDSVRGLIAAIESGITHIDTADVYGHGRSERLVSKAIRGRRESVTLASKVGFVSTSAPSVFSPENIRFQFEQSLRNLETDYIDIYYLHHCDFGAGDEYLQGAIDTLKALRESGKIRAIGLSGYAASDLIRIADRLRPNVIQSWGSIEHPEFVFDGGEFSNYLLEYNIGFVAMMPYGQGRLLGKYDRATQPQFGEGDTRSTNFEFTEDSLKAVAPKLDALKSHFGAQTEDMIYASLGYLLSQKAVVSVIPGYRNSAQVSELIAAAQRPPLAHDDVKVIQGVFPVGDTSTHPWAE